MPILNNPPLAASGSNKSATDINDHTSEAAKVKRTREQAYFNSYDFDAIEVLHFSDEDEQLDDRKTRDATALKNSQHAAHRNGDASVKGAGVVGAVGINSGIVGSDFAKFHSQSLNANGRRGWQNASLSSKSNSSGIPSSGSTRSSSSYTRSSSELKYSYMQRLGAMLVNANSTADAPTAKGRRSTNGSEQLSRTDEIIMGVRSGDSLSCDAESGNFLLPRAMLKYQSSAVITNSMPLAAVAAAPTTQVGTAAAKFLPNNSSTLSSNAGHLTHSANGARLSYTSGDSDENTGFLFNSEKVSSKAVAVAVAAAAAAVARKKKESSSSTNTTTPSHTSVEQLPSALAGHDDSGNNSTIDNGSTILGKSKSLATTASAAEIEVQRGRANSHQSHYSTDKSGSSGYYSSNVCSTYSLDDHIYSEPVIDIVDLNSKSKSVIAAKQPPQRVESGPTVGPNAAQKTGGVVQMERGDLKQNSLNAEMNGISKSTIFSGRQIKTGITGGGNDEEDDDDDADDNTDGGGGIISATNGQKRAYMRQQFPTPHLSTNLRILENSIENLDRHLRSFPHLPTRERVDSFVQAQSSYQLQHLMEMGEKIRLANGHLPTILEGRDTSNQSSWQQALADDSLLDIDLDSFLLVNERKPDKANKPTKRKSAGIDNPSFLADEQEENNYKCAKYINSCPEDAYRVESDIVSGTANTSVKSATVEHFLKRYEDQIHFQNTRELLEDVREKIRFISASGKDGRPAGETKGNVIPKELQAMIDMLKQELESYLQRMNQHSEMEIRQLCSGLVKNQNIVKMRNAFERRRSISSSANSALDALTECVTYEAIREGQLINTSSGTHEQQIPSIRCASDPNFKMKRKSLTDIFPIASGSFVESISELERDAVRSNNESALVAVKSQLQRNLSFHKPVLNELDSKIEHSGGIGALGKDGGPRNSGEPGDKESILEWHRKKPSIWEMYYGTNRLNQSLLGKRNGLVVNTNQTPMSYPSSRPESDFTLDLPRAEQLRIKMEKEKKFRQRCRYITTFLSLVFFLLTVMVVSLVLTRGKRMFGSMI